MHPLSARQRPEGDPTQQSRIQHTDAIPSLDPTFVICTVLKCHGLSPSSHMGENGVTDLSDSYTLPTDQQMSNLNYGTFHGQGPCPAAMPPPQHSPGRH